MRKINKLRTLLSGMLLGACAMGAFAQSEGQMIVGYSGRDITKSSDWGLENAGTISAAIKLDPAMLDLFSDLRISGVCAGLASRLNVESLKVWVRSSLDDENLAEVEGAPKKGWNDLVFSAPCAVEGNECYVGYTLELSDMSYPVSVVPGESEFGFYLNNGTGWTVPEVADPVVLSLLAVIEADNLPQYDLQLAGAQIPARMKIGSPSTVKLALVNKGCRTVTGAKVRFYENGVKSDLYDVACSLTPGAKGEATVEYVPVGNSRMNDCGLRIVIENLTEGEDENPADNEWTGSFNLCKFDFEKRLFLEEFTTQRCSNCPRAASMIHELLAMPKYEGRIVVCARHSGYGTDIFTTDTDLEMLEMYGSDGTYCPAMMLDRTPFYSNGVPVLSVPSDMSGMTALVDECLGVTASVDIKAQAEYEPETGKLIVCVQGGRDGVFGETDPRISVYLVENDIYDARQAGADEDYWQQHVVRAADSTWGKVIEWNADDEFMFECELDPAKVADSSNTEIIAVVHDYDPTDIGRRTVNNAFSTKEIVWNGFTGSAAVESVQADAQPVSVEYYDLQGSRVQLTEGVSGIFIKRTTFDDNTVKIDKVIF